MITGRAGSVIRECRFLIDTIFLSRLGRERQDMHVSWFSQSFRELQFPAMKILFVKYIYRQAIG